MTTKQHSNADMLSRLPLKIDINGISVNAINMMQLESMPITLEQMQKSTIEDKILNVVMNHLSSGNWPHEKKLIPELKPYYYIRTELSLQDGVIMWGLFRQ